MTDQPPIPYIDAKEFKDFGYLQEVNRQFLHPLGLALATYTVDNDTVDDELLERCTDAALDAMLGGLDGELRNDARAAARAVLAIVYPPGTCALAGVIDYRDDPEGIYFGLSDGEVDDFLAKAGRIADEQLRRRDARKAALGYVVQPVTKERA